MSLLEVWPALLQRRAGLRDVANLPLKTLGSTKCCIRLSGRSTVQEVVFVPSVIYLYLSLGACKALCLVPEEFPFHTPVVAAVDVDPAVPLKP